VLNSKLLLKLIFVTDGPLFRESNLKDENNISKDYTEEDFFEFCHNSPSFMSAIVLIQNDLRKIFFKEKIWNEFTKHRHSMGENGHYLDINQLMDIVSRI
jgi:hypothetical protein